VPERAERYAVASDALEALGDPSRRAIVELLGRDGPDGRSVRALADALPISRPAVSRHLKVLKSAGLVVEEPRGTRRIYRLHDEGLTAVRAYLDRVWGEAAARFRLTAENTGATTDRAAPAPRRRRRG
jgi:DNA-binding transcriptional ArsR family regulator